MIVWRSQPASKQLNPNQFPSQFPLVISFLNTIFTHIQDEFFSCPVSMGGNATHFRFIYKGGGDRTGGGKVAAMADSGPQPRLGPETDPK